MHTNSIEAYRAGRWYEFPKRAQDILTTLNRIQPATDRDICQRLGFSDMNAVRPRITELVRDGIIEEVADRIDSATGRPVRVVRLASRKYCEQQLEMEVSA